LLLSSKKIFACTKNFTRNRKHINLSNILKHKTASLIVIDLLTPLWLRLNIWYVQKL